MNRRTFISAAAGTGLVATAGCTASASQRPPAVPEKQLQDDWELTDEETRTVFDRNVEGVTVTATATTKLYANAALAADLREKTLDSVDGQFGSFFATRVTFDPNLAGLPAGVGVSELVEQTESSARATLEERLRATGLTGVERTAEGNLEVATGETARRTDYTAQFEFADLSFPVAEGRTMTVEGGAIDVAGVLAVWEHDDAVLVAGGAYPAANFERHVERDLSSAIHVSVDVDMGLTPSAYREELVNLISRVE